MHRRREVRKKVIVGDSKGFGLNPGRLGLPATELRKPVWREGQKFSSARVSVLDATWRC